MLLDFISDFGKWRDWKMQESFHEISGWGTSQSQKFVPKAVLG